MRVLLLGSVLGFGLNVAGIGWALTADSRLDQFFAFSLPACGVITLLPTLIARGIRLAGMMRAGL